MEVRMENLLVDIEAYSRVRSSIPPQDVINEFIIRKLNQLGVLDFRFISVFLHS